MTGRRVCLSGPPQKIISLVPSQTELLYDLGAASRIAGQTVFCVHPSASYPSAVKVGGTKKVKYELIHSITPDLVICNKEENTEEIVEELSKYYPVWVSDIKTLDDAMHMVISVGELLDLKEKAIDIANVIKQNFSDPTPPDSYTCIYLIWKKPYMAAGNDTFIHHMLQQAGFDNLVKQIRYPELSIEQMVELNPEVVLLSSEPYPFKEKHIHELSSSLPFSRILLVNGEFFSWYGSRLVNSRTYFKKLQLSLKEKN
jgi:ABC-type Fe3+-hydroxamate transport system substrate-binding protein